MTATNTGIAETITLYLAYCERVMVMIPPRDMQRRINREAARLCIAFREVHFGAKPARVRRELVAPFWKFYDESGYEDDLRSRRYAADKLAEAQHFLEYVAYRNSLPCNAGHPTDLRALAR